MTAPNASCTVSGRIRQQLLLALLWLPVKLAWAQAAAPALAHLVQPKPGARPLGVVLAELSRQGQLPFSYSSSLVPVAHLCRLRAGPARPLGVVLRDVLATEHLSYGLLNGQLVLWPNRVAAPTGVAAVNGRATSPRLLTLLASPVTTSFVSKPALATKAAAAGGHSASRPVPQPGLEAPPLYGPAKQAKVTTINAKSLAENRLSAGITPILVPHPRTNLTTRSRYETRPASRVATAERLAALPVSQTTPARPRSRRSRASSGAPDRSVPRGVASANSPSPSRLASQPTYRRGEVRGPLALLFPRFALLAPSLKPDSSLPSVLAPLALAPGSRPATGPAQPTEESTAKNSLASSGLLARRYLHGEAWGSETLPLNAAVKLGIPRIYLVLGAAVGPFDHPADWAWGAGVGTVGRARGRFTPSLEVLQWFLSGPRGDQDGPRDRLTQLRPALAWQLKQGGRWQLVGGPTLNLATGRRTRGPFPWPLGQNQWLWVNSHDGPSLLRLWPGVQLGLQF